MKKLIFGILLSLIFGLMPVFAHSPVELTVNNTLISAEMVDAPFIITAKVKVYVSKGQPYYIETYQIDRDVQTITLLESVEYASDGTVKRTEKKKQEWNYSQKKLAKQYFQDCIYEASIKWVDE